MYKYKMSVSIAFELIRSLTKEHLETVPFMQIQKSDARKVHKIYEDIDSIIVHSDKKRIIDILEEVRNLSCYAKIDFKVCFLAYHLIKLMKESEQEVDWYLDEDNDGGVSKETYDALYKAMSEFAPENKKLSPWIPDEHAAYRCFEGTDGSDAASRVAFIEKTPSVRMIASPKEGSKRNGWVQGNKGSGGEDGHIPENELYGFYPPSRQWCDEALVMLGYELTN
jgi:hypothetical protein